MLRISKLADYGTLVMAFLARCGAKHEHNSSNKANNIQVHNAKSISQGTHIPVPTVSKLLKLLTHADLLSSLRGANGGYYLDKKAEKISIAAIIAAVEGNHGLTECSHHAGECSLESVCTTRDNWQIINRTIQEALQAVSLASLIEQPKVFGKAAGSVEVPSSCNLVERSELQ